MKRKVFGLVLLVCLALMARAKPSQTITWGGRERTYFVHAPPNFKEPLPLLMVLHGGGGSATQAERFTGFSRLADEKGFLVLYPDGIDHGWNDGRDGEFTPSHREKVDDVGFLRAAVEEVAERYPVDRTRIYATGISNGGFMSFRLAAEASDLFCAVAPLCAGIPKAWADQMAPTRPVSVLMIQGTEDPLVPYGPGFVAVGKHRRGEKIGTAEAVLKWCQRNNCRTEGQTTSLPDLDPQDGCQATSTLYSSGQEGTEVALIRVQGGGHTWPGRPQYLPKALIGEVCRDFDASPVIWDFLAAHHR